MEDAITVAVDVETGQFLERAGLEDGHKVIRIVVPRNPDVIRERYTGDEKDPFRPATPEEMGVVLEGQKTDRAVNRLAPEIEALLIVGLAVELGKPPTPAEIDARKALWVNAYKALL